MSPHLLEELGLNPTQAKCYLTLIETGELTPQELANKTAQKRTNAYMVLESLEKLGLVERSPNSKKKAYQAANPIALEKLSEERRQTLSDAELKIKQAMPSLLSYYYSFTEKPGIKLVQGIEGLRSIYQDTLRAKTDIYLLRTVADVPNLTQEYLDKYRHKRANLGITTYAITPDTEEGRRNASSGTDEQMLLKRSWIPKDAYTAPVEMDVYGDKTAFLIYGEETMGIVIDSPNLAKAMRQLFSLLKQQTEESSH